MHLWLLPGILSLREIYFQDILRLLPEIIQLMHSFEVNIRICQPDEVNIIQLMHSFEVAIRICQPENSDVHLVD